MKKSRGRPRNLEAQAGILAAASELLVSGGLGAVTMEAVARAAGVGKPTIYRYWPTRESLLLAALLAEGAPDIHVTAGNSPLEDLHRHLAKVVGVFTTPRGRALLLMLAASDHNSELAKAFRSQIMQAGRAEGLLILQRAAAGKIIRDDIDFHAVIDMLLGAIFYRLMMGHAPIDSALIKSMLSEVGAGLRPR